MKKELSQLKATIIVYALIIIMVISFIVLGCNTTKNTIDSPQYKDMYYVMDTTGVSKNFVDSICEADTLGEYPSEWTYTPLRSDESRKDMSTYGWLKASNWTFYRVIKEGNKYRVTVRSIK